MDHLGLGLSSSWIRIIIRISIRILNRITIRIGITKFVTWVRVLVKNRVWQASYDYTYGYGYGKIMVMVCDTSGAALIEA